MRFRVDPCAPSSPEHRGNDALLEAEHQAREGRRVRTALRLTSLPNGRSLADFDFAFQPAINCSRIDILATCAYVRAAETILIQGPSGVSKNHLAVGLGVKAVEHEFSAQFYRCDELKPQLKAHAHCRRHGCAGASTQHRPADPGRTGFRADDPRRG